MNPFRTLSATRSIPRRCSGIAARAHSPRCSRRFLITSVILFTLAGCGGGDDGITGTVPGGDAPDAAPRSGIAYVTGVRLLVVTESPSSDGHLSVGGSAIGFHPDGSLAYIVSSGTDQVFVIDTRSRTEVGAIHVSNNPRAVAFSPDGAVAYVLNEEAQFTREGTVSVIDVEAGAVLSTIVLEDTPREVAFTPDGALALVTTAKGVTLLDTRDHSVAGAIEIDLGAWGIAVAPDGTVAYAATGSAAGSSGEGIEVLDVATRSSVGTIPIPHALWVDFTPDGRFAYVAINDGQNFEEDGSPDRDEVHVVEVSSGSVIKVLSVDNFPTAIAVSPDGSLVYVRNPNPSIAPDGDGITVLDVATQSVAGAIDVPTEAASQGDLAFQPGT